VPAPDTAVVAGKKRSLPDTTASPSTPQPPPPPPALPAPAPHLVSLRLSPATAALEAGATASFQASGIMSDGTAAGSLAINWAAQGGTITSSGLFTAGVTIGSASVTATSGTISAVVAVTIISPPVQTVLLPTRSADDFVNSIGVNIHLGYWDTVYGAGYDGIIKPRLLQLGVRHVRDAGTVVADDSWMQSVYGRMQGLADRGIKVDLVMQPAVGSNDFTALGQWNRLMGFVSYAVESFEGLNEHDLSGRPNWVSETSTFQMALFASVRSDGRTGALPVYGPSMGQPVNAPAMGSLSGYMDDGNIHPYPGGNVPLANLATHERLTAPIMGNHPWIVTETGYNTAVAAQGGHPPVSEAAMARYVPRLLLDNFGLGISRSYLYELIDEGTSLANQEQAFGLVRNDGSPKPAFTAVRNLIAILTDPGVAFVAPSLSIRVSGDTTGVTRLAFTKRDGRQYMVLYQDASSFALSSGTMINVPAKLVTLQFANPMQLNVYDPLVSASAQSAQRASSLTVTVADSPIVIEIGH
jgi:hypothetical protein